MPNMIPPAVNNQSPKEAVLNGVTVWVIVAVLVIATVVDVYQTVYHGSSASISATIWALSREYPALPFLIGFLCGHLLWPQGK